MLRIFLLMIISLLFVSCNKTQEKKAQAVSTTEDTFLIKIKEMGCRSCVRRIKKHLYINEGIQSVKASIPDRTLTFKLSAENYQSKSYLKAKSLEAIQGESRTRKCKICFKD